MKTTFKLRLSGIIVFALLLSNPEILWSRPWTILLQVDLQKKTEVGIAAEDDKTIQLLTDTGRNFNPSFAPVGKSIFFSTGNRIGNRRVYQICRMDLETREITVLSGNPDYHDEYPICSPDGKSLAFSSRPVESATEADNVYRVFVMDIDGKNRRPIDPDSPAHQVWPSWSPDSKKIVYVYNNINDRILIFPKSVLKIRDLEKQTTTDLLPFYYFATNPSWSPSGEFIAFTKMTPVTGSCSIYIVRPDGSDRRKITSGPEDNEPSWSPENSKVIFSRMQGALKEIFWADIQSSKVESFFKDDKYSLEFPRLN